jgi:ketosteroid isomerase-like protein
MVAMNFVERINAGDVDGLATLMAEDYVLTVFDEDPQRGREAGIAGWRGYCAAFPNYIIYPSRVAAAGERVALLGSTTGSHLGLPDDEERALTLIWVTEVRQGLIAAWTLIEDTPKTRVGFGLAVSGHS